MHQLVRTLRRRRCREQRTAPICCSHCPTRRTDSKQWPLTLEFAINDKQRSDFAADVAVKVHGAKGHAVLDTTAGGPVLLAKLPPGRYAVDATLAGITLHARVNGYLSASRLPTCQSLLI